MATEKSRFFDAIDGDLSYSADEFAEFFRLFLTDGVKNLGTNLKVMADTGMSVKVSAGEALIQGYPYWLIGNDKTISLNYATSGSRIDRIVLRLDKSISVRSITLTVKEGAVSANPVPPVLERAGNIYELALAQVKINSNSTSISENDITDERNDQEVCGMINSLITLDTSDMEQEYQAVLDSLREYVAEELPLVVIPVGEDVPVSERVEGRYYFESTEKNGNEIYGELQDSQGNKLYPENKKLIPVEEGGTGAVTAAEARTNLGAAASQHSHSTSDLTGTLSVTNGGTGAATASEARTNLGAAASQHSHSSSDLTNVVPVSKGGTGASSKKQALQNLGVVYSSSTPGNPSDGTIWLKPV